jgi:hypothetical protein
MALTEYAGSAASVGVMTVSEHEEAHPDVLIVDPLVGYAAAQDRPISMLLFEDQNDPAYSERFKAAAALFRSLPDETPVLESAWFSESGVEPERGVRYYGIGYSHSTADFPRGMVELTRRLVVPERQLCGSCPRSANCLDMLATPWARSAQPERDRCGIKEGLDLLYCD